MPNDYDPFGDLDDEPCARKLETLEKGKSFKVVKLYAAKSIWKDPKTQEFPYNTHCVFLEDDLVCSTVLPKKFNNKPDLFYLSMNKLIQKGMGPKLVYYGKVGLSNMADLLRHTQEINQERLRLITGIEKREADTQQLNKRKSDGSTESEPELKKERSCSTSPL